MRRSFNVLLVEDEAAWQEAIAALLKADERFVLSAVADCYDAAIEAFQRSCPDFVLLDWKIRGDKDGLEVGRQFLDMGLPAERIILISGSSPGEIPPHPYLYVPKARIAVELEPLLQSLVES
jgi:DNA-binding NarL/FixJ family response regulator